MKILELLFKSNKLGDKPIDVLIRNISHLDSRFQYDEQKEIRIIEWIEGWFVEIFK